MLGRIKGRPAFARLFAPRDKPEGFALDPPCARRLTEGVGTRGVPSFLFDGLRRVEPGADAGLEGWPESWLAPLAIALCSIRRRLIEPLAGAPRAPTPIRQPSRAGRVKGEALGLVPRGEEPGASRASLDASEHGGPLPGGVRWGGDEVRTCFKVRSLFYLKSDARPLLAKREGLIKPRT